MDQPTILMVSEEAALAHVLKERWQQEAHPPAFTLMGSDLCRELAEDAFTVAVVGPLRAGALSGVLNDVHPTGKPLLLVCSNFAQAESVRNSHPAATVVMQQEGWPVALASLTTPRAGSDAAARMAPPSRAYPASAPYRGTRTTAARRWSVRIPYIG